MFECLETCSHQWQVLSPSTVFGNTSMSLDRWILSSVWPQHIYSHLLVCTLVPWFPFSLLVGDLASVNGIHQWPLIRRWTTMFDLDTSICIVVHVLVAVCASLICYLLNRAIVHEISALVTWFHICQIFPATMEILLYYIFSHYGDHGPLYIFIMEILIYVYCTWRWPHMWYHVSCLFMAIVLLCIRDCYMYL